MLTQTRLQEIQQFVDDNLPRIDFQEDMIAYENGEPFFDESIFSKWEYTDDILYGCSKMVIKLHWYDDIVLKIPYHGVFSVSDEYEEFTGAAEDCDWIKKWDYCAAEADIFDLACQFDIGDMFAGTYYLCDINSYPIYCAEKADAVLDLYSRRTPSILGSNYSAKKLESGAVFTTNLSSQAIGLFYDGYGKEKTDALLDFLVKNKISDLHGENVAMCGDKIKLIDYSGFNG